MNPETMNVDPDGAEAASTARPGSGALHTGADAGAPHAGWSVHAGHRTPEEIERDIELTRRELGRTLDALQARLSVRRRVDAALETAQENGRRFADLAVSTARRFPAAATALVALPVLIFIAARTRRWRH